MKKIYFIPYLFFLIISCSDNIVDSKLFGYGEDYLIYETILKDGLSRANKLIVLNDSTIGESFDSNSVNHYSEQIPEVSIETLNNYIEVNRQKVRLKRIRGIDFIFLSESNNDYKNKVNVFLSRVGYNSKKSQAIVTMGVTYAPLAGSGTLYYLEKTDGVWKIRKKLMTWIS